MSRLFRSKPRGLAGLTDSNHHNNKTVTHPHHQNDDDGDAEEEEFEEEEEEEEDDEDYGFDNCTGSPVTAAFTNNVSGSGSSQFAVTVLDVLVTALRKSLVTCSVEREDVTSMDISWPTRVSHVSHVTFDRFDGFLGLPPELQPEVPRKVPSASANVFGVSARSMQCSYDDRGNSVPTILLMMQRRLYVEGGLKVEGIFRINAENSQEEYARDQLNRGVVPRGIDLHCLAGLIKAWFRELPSGVLDSLTPEQVMHCNAEDDCTQLVKLLPSTEAELLDWAINLMADVVEHEQYNRMNARNIAMVFAPNMTQMADPLTALLHAVQVMNLLKTLVLKTLWEREESTAKTRLLSARPDSPNDKSESKLNSKESEKSFPGTCPPELPSSGKFLSPAILRSIERNNKEQHWSFRKKSDVEEEFESVSDSSPPSSCEMGASEHGCEGDYGNGDWLSLRKGVRRLCRYPVFQLSKPAKKTVGLGIVNTRGGGEAWAMGMT